MAARRLGTFLMRAQKLAKPNVMLTSFGGAQDGISAGGETKKQQHPSKAPSTI
jgi:hypothetical protein